VDPSRAPDRSWRLYAALALALFLVHAVLLLAAPHWSALPLFANLIQLGFGALAAAAAWHASHRASGFIRTFWRLQAAGFVIWMAAQSLATIYDSILHKSINEPWPSDILYFLWMTPAFLSLFLDAREDREARDWQEWLDFIQVGILVAALYLFTFEVPAHWQRQGVPIAEIALMVEWSRDALLVSTFLLRAIGAQTKETRSLFGRMAIFFLCYASAECPYLYHQVVDQVRPGTWWDLPWSLALAVGTVLIATCPYTKIQKSLEPVPPPAPDWRRLRVFLRLVPLAFPLVVLLMAAHIAEQQFALAVIAVLASFACSSVRIVLTERQQRQASEALEERNALLKSIFEGTGDALFIKDLKGRYVIANQTYADLAGMAMGRIPGKSADQLTDAATAKRLAEQDRAVVESGRGQSFEYELTIKDRPRTFFTTKAPHRDANGKIIGVIGVVRDITEYRALEERLRQSQKMEAIGTLAGGVAHDFNNILMVISGYSSVLGDALASDPKLRGHVEQIQKAGERAASLTRQLLAFSRKQAIQPAPLNLNGVVGGIEKLLRRLISENITISTHLSAELGMILADAGQIEQVILNLAVNARDAMPQGGRFTLETRNAEFADSAAAPNHLKPGRYVEFIVTDTGIGMGMEVQAHVFEPFFTTKPSGKGTGLGLSTVYGIVQQANGHITFTSQPGGGTTFRIYLPRIDSPQSAGVLPDVSGAALDGSETVLLVEDDASVCELVRAVLSSHGYTVLSARRPHEAEVLCEKNPERIDLLLSDVVMPEMSGTELSKRLGPQNPRMKVLFMSGYIDDSVIRQGIQGKEVAFLQKPFSPQSLAKKVREVLDGLRVR
jgi:two-component system cell cycle sensor histidine kinase/response regulator CckA